MRFLLISVLLWVSPAPEARALERFDFSASLMGTTFHIALHADSKSAAESAAEAAFQRISGLNAVFSDYEPNSELMRLCNAGPQQPFKASSDLYELVLRAMELSRLTDGAFDITTGNLTRLWRRTRRMKQLPPEDRLRQALAATDWKAVRLDEQAQTITLLKPGMLLDLGGIAKGRAADEALRVLRRRGLSRALVMAGGDIAVGEPPPGQDAWDIKIRAFAAKEGGAGETPRQKRLKNCAVSTSGDLYQFVEIAGTRYSHIVSPRTGLGLAERVACTVIAPDCTTSDALATAMCVLGREQGEKAAKALPGVTVIFALP